MTKIRIDYDNYRHITHHRDPKDDWDRDNTAGDINIHGIILVGENDYQDLTVPFDIDINKSYILLWADYSTGDSFGHDDNQVEFIDLFETMDRAIAARKAFLENNGDSYSCKYIREDGTEISVHVPWSGYFEHLNDLRLEVVHVTKIA